jgi:hypothetical protein
MLDRRQSAPDKLMHGRGAENGKPGQTSECAVRDSSEKDVPIEFDPLAWGQCFFSKMVWWRDRFVGIAFISERAFKLPASDLDRRLRRSEKKKRQLQRRINQLLRQG